MSHEHDWQPIEGWCGRYRCSKCQVIGYRKFVMDRTARNGTVIIPYACAHPGCNRKAQVGDKYGRRFCFEHWKRKEHKAHPEYIGVFKGI